MKTCLESLSERLKTSRIVVDGSTLREVEPPVQVDTSSPVPHTRHGIVMKVSVTPTTTRSRNFATIGHRTTGIKLVERSGLLAMKPMSGPPLLKETELAKPLKDGKRLFLSTCSMRDFTQHCNRHLIPFRESADYEVITIPTKEFDHIVALATNQLRANNEVIAALQRQTKAKEKLNLFNPVLDEEELANCLYGLYIDCTKSKRMTDKDRCDKMKFAAFLYYLVKDSVFTGNRFSKTRFYMFIQQKVFKELEQNLRTFNNRVTDLAFLDKAMKHPKDFAQNPDFTYFQHLKSKFQNSDFFKSLARLRSGLSSFL